MIWISRNICLINIRDFMWCSIVIGIGNSSAISTPKIMKFTVVMKSRGENSSAEIFGSNSHSNGNLFSRPSLFFFQIRVARFIMAVDNMMVTFAIVVIVLFSQISWSEVNITSLVLDKYYFIFLLSSLRFVRIVKLRLQIVGIVLLLQIRSDSLMRSVAVFVVVDMWLWMFQ